jgi:2-dehydropantoate 2-reductase
MASLPFMQPLHILGSGSIGLLWAASIRSAFPSYPLALLFRSHHKSRIADWKEVVVCMRQNKRPRMVNVPAQFIGDDNKHRIRNLILSTKAYQAADAVQSILPRLDPENLRIMVLCNGALDVRETLVDILAKQNIHNPQLVMCTTTNGVYQEPPDEDMFHLVQGGPGRTFLGGMSDLAQLWDQSGLNAKAIEPTQMEVLLWQKLAANCVCNPLTALWEIPNGALFDQPSFASTREQVVREVSQVGQALHPDLKEQLSPVALDEFVEQVIQDNLKNKSSMFHDVKKQQQTEVDNLNGYVVQKGLDLGIDTPGNNDLLLRIQEITTSCTIDK